MRKTLEDFYFGNIIPSERQMTANSKLRQALDTVTRCESQLMERLEEPEQALLTELVGAQHKINSIEALENFILGFRLGVRMMADCMDEDDGDLKGVE